jgi:hypothetical protein
VHAKPELGGHFLPARLFQAVAIREEDQRQFQLVWTEALDQPADFLVALPASASSH